VIITCNPSTDTNGSRRCKYGLAKDEIETGQGRTLESETFYGEEIGKSGGQGREFLIHEFVIRRDIHRFNRPCGRRQSVRESPPLAEFMESVVMRSALFFSAGGGFLGFQAGGRGDDLRCKDSGCTLPECSGSGAIFPT